MTNDKKRIKIEIFIPENYIETLRDELAQIGVGRIGNYDHCISYTPVQGYWRPLTGAVPYQGEVGQISSGSECKVEINCEWAYVQAALGLIRKIHPYDEPLINLVPLVNHLFE